MRRINNLIEAHECGIKTWVSFEPVLYPGTTLKQIEDMAPFTDRIMVGKWNHDKRADAIDWNTFGHEAESLLKSLGKDYYIKDALRRCMK